MTENKTFTGKTCSVTVIEDSISQISKVRLTTLQLKYPRWIHAEARTHRVISSNGNEYTELAQDVSFMSDPNLSRNASSSRAIPARILIEQQRKSPAFFAHLGKNQPGMQAHEEVDLDTQEKFKNEWLELANIVADYQERWSNEYGLHKQIVNRAGENFGFISVVVS